MATPEVERTRSSWRAMRSRCDSPKNAKFFRYGARGIKVCSRWGAFENFLTDMGLRPAGTSLDRIDNSKGYEPGNCRWADATTQARNTCTCGPLITFRGRTESVSTWSVLVGLSDKTLRNRLRRGWDVNRALTTPAKPQRLMLLEHGGFQRSLAEWAREIGVSWSTLRRRLDAGLATEAVLSSARQTLKQSTLEAPR